MFTEFPRNFGDFLGMALLEQFEKLCCSCTCSSLTLSSTKSLEGKVQFLYFSSFSKVYNFKMSAPLFFNKDDLREQENFNYSAIDQYWQDYGYTEDNLKTHYKVLIIGTFFQPSFV